MKLSPNLWLKEVVKSNTAESKSIDNTPELEHLYNLIAIANAVFQPLRDYFNVPIGITSGYRCKALNEAIGGSSSSQHCKGSALDIDTDMYGKITNEQIFNFIKNNLVFDQLIAEFVENGSAMPVFKVRNELTRQMLNAPTGGESQSEFLGKMMVRGLCERFYTDIKHDIIPYLFNTQTGQFEDIQPLVFKVTNTTDTITVEVLDSAVLANVQVSLDGVTWQSELTFANVQGGDYTVFVKEREEIVLTQNITI